MTFSAPAPTSITVLLIADTHTCDSLTFFFDVPAGKPTKKNPEARITFANILIGGMWKSWACQTQHHRAPSLSVASRRTCGNRYRSIRGARSGGRSSPHAAAGAVAAHPSNLHADQVASPIRQVANSAAPSPAQAGTSPLG